MRTMETDNETVDQACESICELVIAIHDKEHNEKQEIKNAWHIVQQVKDRFLAAHKREMADEKRISDAVIQSLRDKKLEMAGEIAEKDEEIAGLRALVAQYWDTVIFMANGKAYNIAEVVAEGVNRLVESEEPSF